VARPARRGAAPGDPDRLDGHRGRLAVPAPRAAPAVEPDAGRRLLPALRSTAVPAVAERVEAMPYLVLQRMDDEVERHHRRRYSKGHYLRELPDEAIEAFVARGARPGDDPALLPSGGLQAYGGQIAAIGDDETAFVHRDALVEFGTSASWTDPTEDDGRVAAARRFGAAIEPFASGVYVNVLADEGEAGVRRAYGSKLDRLAALKDRYDPGNVFHLNQNIRPARAAACAGGRR
jgi:Berberine and berberine like